MGFWQTFAIWMSAGLMFLALCCLMVMAVNGSKFGAWMAERRRDRMAFKLAKLKRRYDD